MKIFTKLSIGTSVLAPVIGGLGWYLSNKEEPLINNEQKSNVGKPSSKPSFSEFWDGRIEILEKELVRLNKEGGGKAEALAKKIDPQYGHIFFALRPDGNGLHPETTEQRNSLNRFCSDVNRKGRIDENLDKQICENIDYRDSY